MAAAVIAAAEWDQRTGIASLREQYARANRAENTAAMRMARTKPATLAGAAALLNYARPDGMGGLADWQKVAFKTCAVALKRMEAA